MFPKALRGLSPCFIFIFLAASFSPAAAFQSFDEFIKSGSADRHVRIQATVDPPQAASGSSFKLILSISIDEGWHIYSLNEPSEGEPVASRIQMAESPFLAQGKWSEQESQVTFDGVLERVVQMHLKSAEFVRNFLIPDPLAPGTYPISGTLVFRACDNRVCTLPHELTFRTLVQVDE